MKSKKFIIIFVCIFSLIFGGICFDTHYAVIDKKIYKNDIKKIDPSLDITSVREINKCTEVEQIWLTRASENTISKFRNFHNLNDLMIMSSDISSADCEKISKFDNLKELTFFRTNIDFKGFNSDTVSSIVFIWSTIKNFEELAECKSLKSITISASAISDNDITKDSSIFASFDYVEELHLNTGKIEDVSGFLEMDSLKVVETDKGTLSEDDKRLLEDKGISVIEND
ncbi:MAG: hypothetical protein K2K66_02400 [Ruminococcus sp.]|nr:hypothetical protein [Ruminococcus sp.]